jgi:hypothetical protein
VIDMASSMANRAGYVAACELCRQVGLYRPEYKCRRLGSLKLHFSVKSCAGLSTESPPETVNMGAGG